MYSHKLISNPLIYQQKLIFYAQKFQKFVCLDSHSEIKNYNDNATVNCIFALGAKQEVLVKNGQSNFDALKSFIQKPKWAFGFLTYDLKNEIESNLKSQNTNELDFPELYFFEPEILIVFKDGSIEIETENEVFLKEILDLDQQIFVLENIPYKVVPKSRINKDEYLNKVKQIQNRINRGDIYELNFCHEFYANNCNLNPYHLFLQLSQHSPAPFSSFFRLNEHFILCASPERFLQKKGNKILSQPIKGTIKRGETIEEDQLLKQTLRNNLKEQSENVMIVDLVRNDLSHIAKDGSVKVDELFGIYTFPQVHQMISSISCEIKESIDAIDVIKACFPMGSMTGAPKVKAMELIDLYESSKRGVYSGSIGYFSPNGDFDFNVVIRSILYNDNKQKLSFSVGGAITHHSVPEEEYQETLIKAKAIFEVLGA